MSNRSWASGGSAWSAVSNATGRRSRRFGAAPEPLACTSAGRPSAPFSFSSSARVGAGALEGTRSAATHPSRTSAREGRPTSVDPPAALDCRLSTSEVLSCALLTFGFQRFLRDQLLDRQVELLGYGAHTGGDLFDPLTAVTLHVVEQASGQALDLPWITLLSLLTATTATKWRGAGDGAAAAATATRCSASAESRIRALSSSANASTRLRIRSFTEFFAMAGLNIQCAISCQLITAFDSLCGSLTRPMSRVVYFALLRNATC